MLTTTIARRGGLTIRLAPRTLQNVRQMRLGDLINEALGQERAEVERKRAALEARLASVRMFELAVAGELPPEGLEEEESVVDRMLDPGTVALPRAG